MRKFIVLCKSPEDKRGQYSEEIDIEAWSAGRAITLAQAILDRDYDPGMRAVRVIRVL